MSGENRIILSGSELEFFGSANFEIEAAYNPNSQFYLDTVQIYDWNQGPGTGLPNSWLYKGQDYYANERKLYDQISTEMINHHGMVAEYYLTSYDVKYDKFFGEDLEREVERKFDFMFHSDEMPEPMYAQTGWGLWADDTFTIHITKTHFTEASTRAGIADDGSAGVNKGFVTKNVEEFKSESSPRKGDYIRLKPTGVYFKILGVHNKYQSLQGYSYWIVTIKLMKDNQDLNISDEYGQAADLQDIANASNQSITDTSLFDLSQAANDAADEVAYQEKPEEASQMNDAWAGDEMLSSDNNYWD